MKICRVCKTPQPIENFSRNKLYKDGHLSICKSCDKIRAKKWYQDNLERERGKRKMWQDDNMELHNIHVKDYLNREKTRKELS